MLEGEEGERAAQVRVPREAGPAGHVHRAHPVPNLRDDERPGVRDHSVPDQPPRALREPQPQHEPEPAQHGVDAALELDRLPGQVLRRRAQVPHRTDQVPPRRKD